MHHSVNARLDHFSRELAELDDSPRPAVARSRDPVVEHLSQLYSYVEPSERALQILGGIGPIVEIGAGTGYWAHRLRAAEWMWWHLIRRRRMANARTGTTLRPLPGRPC